MSYSVNGSEIKCDSNGYLTDINDWSEDVAKVIAENENLSLNDKSWDVINYLRNEYINNGNNQPNDRNIVKAMSEKWGQKVQSKELYDLFPMQPSKQATKVAGLPETRRKGGY